jgi:hypothetical protein
MIPLPEKVEALACSCPNLAFAVLATASPLLAAQPITRPGKGVKIAPFGCGTEAGYNAVQAFSFLLLLTWMAKEFFRVLGQ